MDEKQLAFRKYAELAIKAHKLEEDILEIPKSAAKRSNIEVDLLFIEKDKPKILKKLEELKGLKSTRDEA